MTHEEIKIMIPAYLEGELDGENKKIIEKHLEECIECRQECAELSQLEEVLNTMEFKKPSKDIWDVYWSSVYNRLERKIGWILLSIGMIIMLAVGAYPAVKGFISDPQIPMILKLGLLAFVGGGIIVFVSIFREQLFFRKKERYKDVRR